MMSAQKQAPIQDQDKHYMEPEKVEAGKNALRGFWGPRSCGEVYAVEEGKTGDDKFHYVRETRYELTPYIKDYADFESGQDKEILEIGVGMGSDHSNWAASKPKRLCGIDLTDRAIENTTAHLKARGLSEYSTDLRVGDAENNPHPDNSFDIVYSWGVIHHSPNTPKAVSEIHRVLKPGGQAKIMVYHNPSLVGMMIWVKHALLKGKPFTPLSHVYSNFMESPGTKAYSPEGFAELFKDFSKVETHIELSNADLLVGKIGQKHQGWLLSLGRKVWPRWFIRRFCKGLGNNLILIATK